jgi:hypothetical protein
VTYISLSSNFDVIDKVALEEAFLKLPPMYQEILHMYYWLDKSFEEIGVLIGPKYRGRVLKGSTIRYHHKNVIELLKPYFLDK